jgi:Lipocalin-like domain
MRNERLLMNRFAFLILVPIALTGLAPASDDNAIAQQVTPNEQVVGTWTLVSAVIERNGQNIEPFGSNPLGYMMLTGDGYFSVNFVRADRPLFASNNRDAGTPQEYKAAVQGNISAFGRYKRDPDGTVTFEIVGSSFPNWTGPPKVAELRLMVTR